MFFLHWPLRRTGWPKCLVLFFFNTLTRHDIQHRVVHLRLDLLSVTQPINTNTSIARPTVWPMAHYNSQSTRVSRPYADWNKNDLRKCLELLVEQDDVFSLVGSQFQAPGAASEKAVSPGLRCVRAAWSVEALKEGQSTEPSQWPGLIISTSTTKRCCRAK